jgi:hypothetical protein
MTTFSSNRLSTFSGLRLCSYFLCVMPCVLTGCVANWSVLGERIPGGTQPKEVACSTCAAPQGVVAGALPMTTPVAGMPVAGTPVPPVPPQGTVGTQANAAVDQANKSATSAPDAVPETPVVSDAEKLRTCEQNMNIILEELAQMKDRDQQRTEAYSLLLQQVSILRNDLKAQQTQEALRYESLNQTLNEFGSIRNSELPETGSPQPLQTPPVPQASDAVNELKALPPVNGNL